MCMFVTNNNIMRTVILVGSLLISDAIRIQKHSSDAAAFVSILLVCCVWMDMMEFIKRMKKYDN